MAKIKKKAKTPVKKDTKSQAKKKSVSIVKKAAKSPAKKKSTTVLRKKAKGGIKKKVISSTNKKIKSPISKKTAKGKKKIAVAPKPVPVPEVIKQNEVVHPIPGFNETHPQTTIEHKKFEQEIHSREDVIMKQENQKMKSAMANRQGIKRVFRTQRHS